MEGTQVHEITPRDPICRPIGTRPVESPLRRGPAGRGAAARSVWLREGPGRRGASGLGEALLHLLLNLRPTGVGHMLSNLCPTGVSNVPCFVVVSPLVVAPHGGARAEAPASDFQAHALRCPRPWPTSPQPLESFEPSPQTVPGARA